MVDSVVAWPSSECLLNDRAKTSPNKPKSPFPIDKDNWCFLENYDTCTTFLQLDAPFPQINVIWGNAADCINGRVNIIAEKQAKGLSLEILVIPDQLSLLSVTKAGKVYPGHGIMVI